MIVQKQLPVKPWMNERTRRLPGLGLIQLDQWLTMDDVFAQQMALRDQLLKNWTDIVYRSQFVAQESNHELLECVLENIAQNKAYRFKDNIVIRPDGVQIAIDWDQPLLCAGRLVQEDFLILKPQHIALGQNANQFIEDNETVKKPVSAHQIIAGNLCFPAGWRLSDKMGLPLFEVHKKIRNYNNVIAQRIERILHNLSPEKIIMRANYLIYTNPDLHQPSGEGEEKTITQGLQRFVRVERQTLRKLPKTKAIVFSIHTYVVSAHSLLKPEYDQLLQYRPELQDLPID